VTDTSNPDGNPDGRDGWRRLTIQVGGRTYGGAFETVADEVHVVGDPGAKRARLGPWEAPRSLAERLLAELYGVADAPDAEAEAPPAPRQPDAPAAAAAPPRPPNNLVGLGLLAAFVALGALLHLAPAARTPATFAFVMAGWLLAVMAHEFCHALVAYLGGDRTVRAKGYLAFDPRRYADLGTSLVLPLLALALGGIGFPGGAVWVRNDLMRNRAWRSASALAGPAATLLVLLALAFVLALWSRIAPPDMLFQALAMLAFLQAMALVLNLLPIPGLDGFNVLRPFLPRAWTRGLRRFEGVSMLVLLGLLFFVPGVSGSLFQAAAAIASGLGAPRAAIAAGWADFHFWQG
jgi:Zn-dependent protease